MRSSLQPVREGVQIVEIDADKRAVRTGALAGRTAKLFDAQIAFGRFEDRFHFLVHEKRAGLVADFDHANRVIGTVVEAGFAADAGGRIDHDLPAKSVPVNGAGGAADHAYWIHAVHAG